jgi:hypothetical protein
VLTVSATAAWAGNGNEDNSGNPGGRPGTPGDGNEHCQAANCTGGSDPEPDPDPEPEPEPDPDPEPQPEPEPEAPGGDSGGDSGGGSTPGNPASGAGGDSGDGDSSDDGGSDDPDDPAREGERLVAAVATLDGPISPAKLRHVGLDFPHHPRTHLVATMASTSELAPPLAPQTVPLLGFAIAGLTGLIVGSRQPMRMADAATRALRLGVLGIRPLRMGEFVEHADELTKEELDDRLGVGRGDRSFTWRFPGHRRLDAISRSLPPKIAPYSPFAARLASDGSEFRAMFGALWLLTPLAGAGVGVASALSTDLQPLPPPILLLAAGMVIATFDAFSGAVAALAFALTCSLGGGLTTAGSPDLMHGVLVILTVTFLWCSLPIIGSAVRPFRRIGPRSLRYTWDRAADLAISSLLCAWIASKMVEAMDVFAGMPTGLPRHHGVIAFVTLAAVAARIGAEQLTTALYPQRLLAVEPDVSLPEQLPIPDLLGAVTRTAVFSFMGYAFTGFCWQWWLGTALFLLPQVFGVIEHRFRKVPVVQRFVPRGIVEIFVLIVACTLAARFALTHSESELVAVRWVFLALSIPPAIIGLLGVFADRNAENKSSLRPWIAEVLGLVVFVATTWLALQGWSY